MNPLIGLFLSFVISFAFIKTIKKEYDFALSGRIAMSIMLLFTAIRHFVYMQGMSMMIPKFIPNKKTFIHLIGVFEILLAVGLIIPRFKYSHGLALIILLLLCYPQIFMLQYIM